MNLTIVDARPRGRNLADLPAADIPKWTSDFKRLDLHTLSLRREYCDAKADDINKLNNTSFSLKLAAANPRPTNLGHDASACPRKCKLGAVVGATNPHFRWATLPIKPADQWQLRHSTLKPSRLQARTARYLSPRQRLQTSALNL